jgi:hypothetical protein
MKGIIFTAFLIFAFCFAASAQTNQSKPKATKITEYSEDPSSENVKFAIDDLAKELQNSSDGEGIIKVQAKTKAEIIRQIKQITMLLKFRKVPLTRISFAINNGGEKIIQYWFAPFGSDIADCENCIIIRAEDYDKISDFFYPKPKLKKRKK